MRINCKQMFTLFLPFKDLWARNFESWNSGPPQKSYKLYLSCISNRNTKKCLFKHIQNQALLKITLKVILMKRLKNIYWRSFKTRCIELSNLPIFFKQIPSTKQKLLYSTNFITRKVNIFLTSYSGHPTTFLSHHTTE